MEKLLSLMSFVVKFHLLIKLSLKFQINLFDFELNLFDFELNLFDFE